MHAAVPGFGHQWPQAFPARNHPPMHTQVNLPFGARAEEYQYAIQSLVQNRRARKPRTNARSRQSTPPPRKPKSGAVANGQVQQREYDLHRAAPHEAARFHIDKLYSNKPSNAQMGTGSEKKGRYGDSKIMLPAPQPTEDYLAQAAGEPSTVDTPRTLLVILDLNGTVLHRPNKNAKTMIERPFLKPFLRYLFQHFKVMVWSSAKPDNVKSLVSQALDNNMRTQLVDKWARDSFGLSPTNYAQNVQVYKNLKLVWSRSTIQQHHPHYEAGERFGQHNTVLIDDSLLKANAQPHNLLEIPEFTATPEQMEGDALREVAGYLEMLRRQEDVSKFIRTEPFVCDGRWSFEWPDEIAGGGETTTKAPGKKNKKNKKKQANAAAFDGTGQDESLNDGRASANALDTRAGASPGPLAETRNAFHSVSHAHPLQKDW